MNSIRLALISAFVVACASFAIAGPEVTIVRDQPYRAGDALSPYERERCRLDVYLPAGERGFATLVWFHGGSLTAGKKANADELARRLAERGVAVATVN